MTNEKKRSGDGDVPQRDGGSVGLQKGYVGSHKASEDLGLCQLGNQRSYVVIEPYRPLLHELHGAHGREELGHGGSPGLRSHRKLGRVRGWRDSSGSTLVDDAFCG